MVRRDDVVTLLPTAAESETELANFDLEEESTDGQTAGIPQLINALAISISNNLIQWLR